MQNQLTTIESKLSAEARLVNDLQQECNKQKQLCRQEQEQKVEQEKLKLELEEKLKTKGQNESFRGRSQVYRKGKAETTSLKHSY